MKLYYAPGTCSLSPHILLRELGLDFELVRVDNQRKITADGQSFLDINPKGYVAALALDDGEVITEGPAILQYLGDRLPGSPLVPPPGTLARVRLQEWLNFISAELHAGCTPLFRSDIPKPTRRLFEARLGERLQYVDERLQADAYLLGAAFSAADAYLFTVLTWMPRFDIDLDRWPALTAFMARVGARESVQAARAAEHE